MRIDRRLGWLLILLLCAPFATAQDGLVAIPALTARVTDLTATLMPEQRAALESELTALEQRKGSQLAVLIVPTTQPEDIAAYAIRVFDQWKLGRQGVDDGVLLIIAKDDRRSRIEVGRGLEGAIPDAAVARVLREYLTPKFRSGDFYGGIHDSTKALTALIDGETLPEPWVDKSGPDSGFDFIHVLFVSLFAMFWARAFFGGISRPGRPLLVGGVGGIVAMLVGGSLVIAIGVSIAGLLFGWIGGAAGNFVNRNGRGRFDGGWGGGGFGGGGSSGGGGGGFSGGGGSSAGGGASGSW